MGIASSIYFSKDELGVVQAALETYATALRGVEFGEHGEADQGMRARSNLAKSARGKIVREIGNRDGD